MDQKHALIRLFWSSNKVDHDDWIWLVWNKNNDSGDYSKYDNDGDNNTTNVNRNNDNETNASDNWQ